jgi:hypothetical protein
MTGRAPMDIAGRFMDIGDALEEVIMLGREVKALRQLTPVEQLALDVVEDYTANTYGED